MKKAGGDTAGKNTRKPAIAPAKDLIKNKSTAKSLKPHNYVSKYSIPTPQVCTYQDVRPCERAPWRNGTKLANFKVSSSGKVPLQPREILQRNLAQLRSLHDKDRVQALRDLVEIARLNPDLMKKYLPGVYRELGLIIQTPRATVASSACHTAAEIFKATRMVEGQELEDLARVLLQESSSPNETIREKVLEALESFILHASVLFSVKVLLHKTLSKFSTESRTNAAKLLACLVNLHGADIATNTNRKTKLEIINMAVVFMQNESFDMRKHGMTLVSVLMRHEEFTKIIRENYINPVLKSVTKARNTSRLLESCKRYNQCGHGQ